METLGGGEYLFVPQRWEQRPMGYEMVPARVSQAGDRIEGQIEAPYCGALSARRTGKAKTGIAGSPANATPGRDGAAPAPRQQALAPAPRRPAAAAADPSIFLPGNKDRLEQYLVERATGIKAVHRTCLHKLETRYSPSSRPLPAAEQIRRSNEGDAMLADCNRQTEADLGAMIGEFRVAANAWARQQPATYDGLRSLRSAEAEYRTIGQYRAHDSIPFAVGARVRPMIAEVFGQRRAEIEPQVRSALMADVVREGSTQRVADLFYDDQRIVASYGGALKEQRAAATRSAAMAAVPAGPNGDVALAAAAAFGRAPRIALGQSLGMTTVMGTSIDVNAVAATEHYEFKARNAQCTGAGGGRTTCSYELDFGVSGTFAGLAIPMQHSGWVRRRDSFSREGSILRSSTLDRDMAKLAEASNSGAPAGQSTADANAERRRQDCRQSVYSSVMSGDYGSAAATGIAGCQ